VVPEGSAFNWDGHVWFVLSDPLAPSGDVLCVNLTTMDDECPDDECELTNAEYAWIQPNHPTAVAFSRSKIWRVAKLKLALDRGLVTVPNPPVVPLATLNIVRNVGKTSRELGPIKRAML
jgi:hypothetical protein